VGGSEEKKETLGEDKNLTSTLGRRQKERLQDLNRIKVGEETTPEKS